MSRRSWQHFHSLSPWNRDVTLGVEFFADRGFRWFVRDSLTLREYDHGYRATWPSAAQAAEDAAEKLFGAGGEGASYAA